MKKRWMAALLCGVLAAGFLTACGNAQTQTQTSSDSGQAVDVEAEEEHTGEIVEVEGEDAAEEEPVVDPIPAEAVPADQLSPEELEDVIVY